MRRWITLGLLMLLGLSWSGQAHAQRLHSGNEVLVGHQNHCDDVGTPSVYACNLVETITTYVAGARYSFKALNANTANAGAATLNLNGVGAKAIVKLAGSITTALAVNDIRPGQMVTVVYDGTNMQMMSPTGAAVTGTGSDVKATSPTLTTPNIAALSNLTTNGVVTTTAGNGTLVADTSSYTKTIASGTTALATNAIASGNCATTQTVAAPGVLSTDAIISSFNANVTGITGYTASTNGTLRVDVWPSSNNINITVCNNTAASITPGSVTLNWRVVR
jgi:hypothetical protein